MHVLYIYIYREREIEILFALKQIHIITVGCAISCCIGFTHKHYLLLT